MPWRGEFGSVAEERGMGREEKFTRKAKTLRPTTEMAGNLVDRKVLGRQRCPGNNRDNGTICGLRWYPFVLMQSSKTAVRPRFCGSGKEN